MIYFSSTWQSTFLGLDGMEEIDISPVLAEFGLPYLPGPSAGPGKSGKKSK